VKNCVCFSRGVQVTGETWWCSDKDRGRIRRLDAEDQRWSNIGRVLGGRMIGRSGDAVCGLHYAQGDEERGVLGGASKPRFMVCQWFSLKTTSTICQWFSLKVSGTISPGLASKLMTTGFSVWASKPVATD
jgi:hypothetical protein